MDSTTHIICSELWGFRHSATPWCVCVCVSGCDCGNSWYGFCYFRLSCNFIVWESLQVSKADALCLLAVLFLFMSDGHRELDGGTVK